MADLVLIMWSIAQIAERDRISKQAVSKAVKKLLADQPDIPADRGPQGQVTGISLAHYDHYRQRFLNPAKASTKGQRMPSQATADPSDGFDEARRQSEWLKVAREKLRFQEESGQLVRKDLMDAALNEVGATINAVLRRLPNRTDEISRAVFHEGEHGVRVALRKIAFELGTEISDQLAKIAAAAPERDPGIEDRPTLQ